MFRARAAAAAGLGPCEAHPEERRIVANIGVEIWQRAARMIRQCLPSTATDDVEEWQQPLELAALQHAGPLGTIEPPPWDL